MTILVELSPEIEARLTAAAQVRGLAPEQYAGDLLAEVLPPAAASGKLSVTELHAMLQDLAEGSEGLPHLPTSAFTRESFYEDRR